MEDTSRESRALIRKIVMSKTIEQRFLMCAEMYEDAKRFAKIGVPEELDLAEQEKLVFRRIHGRDPMSICQDNPK